MPATRQLVVRMVSHHAINWLLVGLLATGYAKGAVKANLRNQRKANKGPAYMYPPLCAKLLVACFGSRYLAGHSASWTPTALDIVTLEISL